MLHSGQELAHEHVEATVAAKGDDLAEPIQRLDAVGLTERRSDGGVVEGSDDPLRSVLPYPVAGPECVETGIENEDRVAPCKIANRSRHRLRMNAILAARRIGLLVQHLVPLPAIFS